MLGAAARGAAEHPHRATVRPPFVNFYRAALNEIDRQCNAAHGKPFAQLTAAEQLAFIGTMRMGKHPGLEGTAAAAAAIYGRSAPTPSTSCTARSKASSASACPTCRSSLRRRGGDMATQEKVDVAIVGAGPSGVDLRGRAGARRQEGRDPRIRTRLGLQAVRQLGDLGQAHQARAALPARRPQQSRPRLATPAGAPAAR